MSCWSQTFTCVIPGKSELGTVIHNDNDNDNESQLYLIVFSPRLDSNPGPSPLSASLPSALWFLYIGTKCINRDTIRYGHVFLRVSRKAIFEVERPRLPFNQ